MGKNLDNLTKDAIAAEKAGMSYGQWKAQHPHTGETQSIFAPTPLVEGAPGVVRCGVCGKMFHYCKSGKRKYCSPECSYEANLRQTRERERRYALNKRGAEDG